MGESNSAGSRTQARGERLLIVAEGADIHCTCRQSSDSTRLAHSPSAWGCASYLLSDALLQLWEVPRGAGQATFSAPACHASNLAIVVAILPSTFVASSTAIRQPGALSASDERSWLPLKEPIQAVPTAIRHLRREAVHAQGIHMRVVIGCAGDCVALINQRTSAWSCASYFPPDALLQLREVLGGAGQATFSAPACHASELAIVVAILPSTFVASSTAI